MDSTGPLRPFWFLASQTVATHVGALIFTCFISGSPSDALRAIGKTKEDKNRSFSELDRDVVHIYGGILLSHI